MRSTPVAEAGGERGSALILAVLITVILSLLGISYLLMAQTENTIAENERNSLLALYVAEAGARLAVGWFNDPSSTGYFVPGVSQVTRTDRLLDHDGDPATPRVLAVSGDAAKPLYKDAAVTPSGLFDRPYRSALGDTFLGIETGTDPDPSYATKGPDLVVTQSHLDAINDALFPGFPSPDLRAKIARIELYSPPVVSIGGVDTRMGIATIKVTGGVFIYPGTTDERQIATRVVKAVVNEIPVPAPAGPLQSCSTLDYTGSFEIHWGTASSQGNADLGLTSGNVDNKSNTGVPYNLNDPFTYISGADTLASWATAHDNEEIEDPWFKFVAGGALANIGTFAPFPGDPQPWHYTSPGSTSLDHTNLFQNTVMNCPEFDYGLWKAIAQSGNKNHYYFKYDGGGNFRLDGTGPPVDFMTASDGLEGVIFFDTADGQPPNGLAYSDPGTNLTPDVEIDSTTGWQGVQGFLYVNAKSFTTTGTGGIGSLRTIIPPGEPGDGSGFVNLDYPGTLKGTYRIKDGTVNFETFQDPVTGDWWCTDASQCDSTARTPSLTPVKDEYGLPFQETVIVDGVFYTSGVISAKGNAKYFGSVIAEQGVLDGGGTPEFWFDESLVKGNWPRKGMNLPRVVVTSWQTDL
ncbi:MAG: pilus assembly PilX N-terminal domain-containing protein [Acidobacteriota bacterium]